MSIREVYCSFHDPRLWGSHIWYMMDLMVIRLQQDDPIVKEHIWMQFVSLLETIPCETCRIHYQQYYENYPIHDYLSQKLTLAKWVYELRCSVNRKLDQPSLTFDEYLQRLRETFDCDIRQIDYVSTPLNTLSSV